MAWSPLDWVDIAKSEVLRQNILQARREGKLPKWRPKGLDKDERRLFDPCIHMMQSMEPVADHYLSDENPLPQCTNVVIDTRLGPFISLPRMYFIRTFCSGEIVDTFGSVIFRFGEPFVTILVWPNASIVTSGAKSVNEARLSVQHFRCVLKMDGKVPGLSRFSVNNRVHSSDVRTPINIEALSKANKKFTLIPSLFPGAFNFDIDTKTCVLVFFTGKQVGMGPGQEDVIVRYIRSLYPLLMQYRMSKDDLKRMKKQSEKERGRELAFQKEKARSSAMELEAQHKQAIAVADAAEEQRQQQQQQQQQHHHMSSGLRVPPPPAPPKGKIVPKGKAAVKILTTLARIVQSSETTEEVQAKIDNLTKNQASAAIGSKKRGRRSLKK